MAQVETWLSQDLMDPVKILYMDGSVFNKDDKGNLIGVSVFKDGQPFTLSGSVVGYCILSNGVTVPVSGAISSNNKAYIVLPDAAYAVPGMMNIIVKYLDNRDSSITTIAAVVVNVADMGSVVVSPTQQTIDQWTAQINATMGYLRNSAVLYNQSQSLSAAQKAQARTNIGANTSAVLVSGSDYRIVIP